MSGKAKGAVALSISVAVVAFAFLALSNSPASAEPLRIMPLGDSITSGYTNSTWSGAGAFTFGYRGPLYTKLTNAGYSFQFVGGSTEPWTPAHIYQDGQWWTSQAGPTSVSGPDLRTLGQDGHRGYWGQRTDWIQSNIAGYLAADDPDVVLLMLGTNNLDLDVSGSVDPVLSKTQLNDLVQSIVNYSPDVKVIVSTITPRTKTNLSTGAPIQYNNYIKNVLIPHFQNDLGLGNRVTMVDQFANFINTNGTLKTSLLADSVHPNGTGYSVLAQTWCDGIQAVVPAPEPGTMYLLGIFGVSAAAIYWRRRAG